jgi:pimeloyl-ACP methyl ester carboxylesterase
VSYPSGKEDDLNSQPVQTSEATLHDGATIAIEVYGQGPTILLPANPTPIEGAQADEMRKYGGDPALGRNLINGLSDVFRVVVFDYEGHVFQTPKALTLTPSNVIADFLAVADAAGADRFAYYGYSWLAMVGLQFALHTDRVAALMMGGFPPVNGPYTEMLRVTTAAYEGSGGNQAFADDEWSTSALSTGQTQQFVTLYQALQGFDDRAALPQITCPRLCLVGSVDDIEYGKNWGDVTVSLASPMIRRQAELEQLGWEVHILEGLDHMQAMQAAQVLPIIRPWLIAQLSS